MKFTNGYWRLRDGVRPTYAARVEKAWAADGELLVLARTTADPGRGASVGQPLVTFRLSSPGPGVIRVTRTHHAGGLDRGPAFGLSPLDADAGRPAVEIAIGDDVASLRSGDLTATVDLGADWALTFTSGGRPVTRATGRSSALFATREGDFSAQRLELGVGELFYGLGERFGPLVKNGQSVELWNDDGGTSSEQAYKNIPFYISNAGYGVFVNHPGSVSLEVAGEAVSKVQFSVPGQVLDFFVIDGPTPLEVLERYTALTGRAPQVPAWSYGLWLTTSFTTDYNEQTIMEFIDGMQQRDIPLTVFHFDCFWMRAFHWCDFVWDPEAFPDPVGLISRIKQRGLRVCVWINPYIAQASELFAEGKAAGYLLKRPDGSVWQTDEWQAGMALVDFTNPDATAWYRSKLARLLDMGVDCFKTDFGERVPLDVVWSDGSDPDGMHNYYTLLYNQCVFGLLQERFGQGEAVVFARSATTGGQSCPVHWGGDSEATAVSMAETLRGGLSLAASGFGYWSHDIGGFERMPEAWLFMRWLAFGLLSSHSRLHGSTSYRVPWAFGDESVEVARRFARLRMRLMPYLLGQARAVTEQGAPMLRPMWMAFPDDPACSYLDRQYMLGADLLVAPVFSQDGVVSFYVPAGRWADLLSGQVLDGGRWVTQQHGVDSLPLLVRPGAVIPLGAVEEGPEYDWADGVELVLGCFEEGQQTRLAVPRPAAPPALFDVVQAGLDLTVRADAAPGAWTVRSLDPTWADADATSSNTEWRLRRNRDIQAD